ncbi:MAG: hypothetical protein IPM77_01575 [Crocinitomicaceae bacterium]|nr:hypothetical protein [Crocinitomicaceae bacterium]
MNVSAQGPLDGFFKGKNNLDLALSGFYQHSEKYFGATNFNYPRTLSGASIFGEYGILDNLDVIATVPFINGKFQDAGIYFKYGIPFNRSAKERRIRIIPAAGISFPVTDYVTQSGKSIGQKAILIQPKLIFQMNFNHGIFIQAQGGYNYALAPVISSVPFSVKFGWAGNKWYTDILYDFVHGLGDELWIGGVSQDFRTLPVSSQKAGGVIYYSIKSKWGVFANGSYIFSGKNIGNAWSAGAGLVYKISFKK